MILYLSKDNGFALKRLHKNFNLMVLDLVYFYLSVNCFLGDSTTYWVSVKVSELRTSGKTSVSVLLMFEKHVTAIEFA